MTILLNSVKRTQRLIKRWSSLNQSEVDKFAAMSSDWWDQVIGGYSALSLIFSLVEKFDRVIDHRSRYNLILVWTKCSFTLVE